MIKIPDLVDVNGREVPIEIPTMGKGACYHPFFDVIIIPRRYVDHGTSELIESLLQHEIGHAMDPHNLIHHLKLDFMDYATRPLQMSIDLAKCDNLAIKEIPLKGYVKALTYNISVSFITLALLFFKPYYWFYKWMESREVRS